MSAAQDLADHTCRDLPKGTPPLDAGTLEEYLADLPGWEIADDRKAIFKTFRFRNFYETMSFANAVAHIANTQNHHPDLALSYNTARVSFGTHSIGGISTNDVICAAKVERLQKDNPNDQ